MRHSFPVHLQGVIAGKYLIESSLGEGRTGAVFGARHRELGHRVAIKVLRPELAQRAEVVERFRRQASSAASIQSDHVCRVLDVTALDNWLPCVVMERLEGQDLARELAAARDCLPLGQALDYALQACAGLEAALAAGMVHKALKPSKLFLARRVDGSTCVKILGLGSDAGLAQEQLAAADDALARYLAPEQRVDPERVDARTNVWALAEIVSELLGAEPAALPAELARVLERAQDRLAELRFASVVELARELAHCLEAARPAPPTARGPRFPRWMVAGVYVAAIGAAAGFALRRGPTSVEPHSAATAATHAAAAAYALRRGPTSVEPNSDAGAVRVQSVERAAEVASVDAALPAVALPEPVAPRGSAPPSQPKLPTRVRLSDFGGRR